jgi:ADP-ribosylglycohydrolase
MPSTASRIHGCLLGAAAAEAAALAERYHSAGQHSADDGGLRLGAAGQLSLYTADALAQVLEWANDGVYADQAACVWLAFLRWAGGQGVALPSSAPPITERWIDAEPAARRRLPDRPAWVGSLASGEMGSAARPLGAEYDDGGAAARSAPFGLIQGTPPAAVVSMALDGAALTHGDPAAIQAAAAVALIVRELVAGSAVSDAAEAARAVLATRRAPSDDVLAALDVTPEEGARLEDASPAARALAAGLSAAIIAERTAGPAERNERDERNESKQYSFEDAVERAADSGPEAAAIAGAILGTLWGNDAVPDALTRRLEGIDIAARLAAELAEASGAN